MQHGSWQQAMLSMKLAYRLLPWKSTLGHSVVMTVQAAEGNPKGYQQTLPLDMMHRTCCCGTMLLLSICWLIDRKLVGDPTAIVQVCCLASHIVDVHVGKSEAELRLQDLHKPFALPTVAMVSVGRNEGKAMLQGFHARHTMLAGLPKRGAKYWRTGTREEFQWWPPLLPLAWALTEQVSVAVHCCSDLQLIPSS